MGLGGTAKKIQALAERAEQTYEQMMELRERIVHLEESVDETNARVSGLRVESEKQRVLLEAIAEEHGIDSEQLLAEAAIEEAEPAGGDAEGGAETADAETADAEGESPAKPGGATATSGESADAAAETEADEADAGADDADDGPTIIDSSGDPVE